MSLIRLNDVEVRFENTQILREAFFRLETGDRVGLIGRNGSGKSTLLKLVLEQVSPDAGTVTVEPGLTLGYFSQFSELNGEASITDVLGALFLRQSSCGWRPGSASSAAPRSASRTTASSSTSSSPASSRSRTSTCTSIPATSASAYRRARRERKREDDAAARAHRQGDGL